MRLGHVFASHGLNAEPIVHVAYDAVARRDLHVVGREERQGIRLVAAESECEVAKSTPKRTMRWGTRRGALAALRLDDHRHAIVEEEETPMAHRAREMPPKRRLVVPYEQSIGIAKQPRDGVDLPTSGVECPEESDAP